MENKLTDQSGIKFWIIFASMIIVIAGLKAGSDFINPMLLALFISAICLGPFGWLKERGLPEWLIIIIIFLGIAIIAISVILLLGASIPAFIDKAPFYGEKFNKIWENFNQWLVQKGWSEKDSVLSQSINPKSIMTLVENLFSGLGNLMSSGVTILLAAVFFLLEVTLLDKKIKFIKPQAIVGINKVFENVKKYFWTKTVISLATGIFVAIGLAIVGVDFPILWGFLAFLLNYIPNIGSALAGIPAVLLALVQLGPGSAIATTVIYVVVNGVIGNVIEPKVMGKNLGISTLVVFIALIFWGWVLGTIGMLLAVPLTIMIKLTLDGMDSTKWLGLLLGDESSLNNLINKQKDN